MFFIKNSKDNSTYPLNTVFRFIMYQKERLQKKEIENIIPDEKVPRIRQQSSTL